MYHLCIVLHSYTKVQKGQEHSHPLKQLSSLIQSMKYHVIVSRGTTFPLIPKYKHDTVSPKFRHVCDFYAHPFRKPGASLSQATNAFLTQQRLHEPHSVQHLLSYRSIVLSGDLQRLYAASQLLNLTHTNMYL